MRTLFKFRSSRSYLHTIATQRAFGFGGSSQSTIHSQKSACLANCSTSDVSRRASSSFTPSNPASVELGHVPPPAPPLDDPAEDEDKVFEAEKGSEPEKPRRRKATKIPDPDKEPAPILPPGLNVLWDCTSMPVGPSSALPPPDIFQEVLNNLLITLHPQTQHRATYTSASGHPQEPTLALYCPIEGGDYIIDETVKELARKTRSDVIVLDAVQLAAGEWGLFGKAASVLQLPHNPLHFPSIPTKGAGTTAHDDDEPNDGDVTSPFVPISPMTLHVMTPGVPMRTGRQSISIPSSGRSSPTAKVKAFFDELISIPPHGNSNQIQRPRLVYIRDFPTLAASASVWLPPLVQSVRQRRQGPLARPLSPSSSPMTIIFGMTPPIVAPPGPSQHPFGSQGLMGLMVNRSEASLSNTPARLPRNDYGEDDLSERSREKRLRDRLRKWEHGDKALLEEIPRIAQNAIGLDSSGSGARPEVVVIGSGGMGGLGSLASGLTSAFQGKDSSNGDDSNNGNTFFRTSIIVPAMRSPSQERICRIARRREINEITMRMGVGGVGGVLGDVPRPDPSEHRIPADLTDDPVDTDEVHLWRYWGNNVESWEKVKNIADRAVGSVVASGVVDQETVATSTLQSTPIPWPAVVSAWAAQQSSQRLRKAWTQECGLFTRKDHVDAGVEDKQSQQIDEVIQQIKNDQDLSPHEQRLLGCIVDSVSMPTTFSHVHLPPHTIDSVRTIVSLPLIHPAAFQEGILKQHNMTGCLLFGPPGTGKTLVVRALAKEAGCRMLAISPSDVMDMYVGEGEKLVRAVFSLARRLSPCVIFLDEIDALFGARMSARETGGAIAHRGVITEFMQEMDGLKTHAGANVMVIGATNRPFDLDEAILRRLPRRLLVDLPGEKERTEILRILLRDEILAEGVDLQALAKRTDFFSGSDLKHLCVAAALDAVKEHVSLPWDVPSASHKDTSSPTINLIENSIVEKNGRDHEQNAEKINLIMTDESSSNIQLPRILNQRNFEKALKEITPSSSETLGNLTALRRWNEEFGEGRQKRKSVIWGKGLFGFSENDGGLSQSGRVSERD